MSINYCVLEHPDDSDYESIKELLYQANVGNKGFRLKTADYSVKQLINRVGADGKTFVAYDGKKLVGTLSVRFVERRKWYYSGKTPEYILAAVLPEYQGKGINSALAHMVFNYIIEQGYQIIELDTASTNKHAIAVYKHQGFILTDYITRKDTDHYSVVMVKWLGKLPCRKFEIAMRYYIKKIYTIVRYKKGLIKRFF